MDGALAFTGSATRALQAAIREADALGHDVVRTEHLLIALAPESSSSPAAADVTGTRLLNDLGVDAATKSLTTVGPPARSAARR